MEQPKIAVFGDVLLDRYDYCENRENPESSAPCYRVKKTSFLPGGAGNVAANLAQLGADVTLFGIVGDDEHGKILLKEISELGITSKILFDESISTIIKQRILSSHDGRYHGRMDFGDSASDVEKIKLLKNQITEKIRPLIFNGFQSVIVSDYAKGFISKELISEIKKIGCQIYVDPKQNKELYRNVELIKPNKKELANLTNGESDEERAVNLSKELNTNVLLTLGENGMLYAGKEGEIISLAAHQVDVSDVTGSGDTVIATFVFYRAIGRSIEESLTLANKAASINVQHVGCYRVRRDELENKNL